MGKRATRDVPAKKDFTRWYPYIVEAADLVDKRYPIKGMDVWRPRGLKMMRLIDGLTHREMERTGHEEVRFPLLIPDHLLEKENRLVALLKRAREEGVDPSELRIEDDGPGFAKEVYWVRQAGENDLEVPMFLRPTSETAMYTMFPLWIRSHADLPLKTYQIVNTFRYETKQTRSFIRVREIHFFEAHTAHIDEDDATRQIEEDLAIAEAILNDLCIPAIMTKRPVWDTFPGAWYTIAIDAIMPNGRGLQVASVHHYRDQWAKAFDITYEALDGRQAHVHQTTYGMSERLLGAVVGVHGDDDGLILPPAIAPIQIVVIPILRKGTEDSVMQFIDTHVRSLREAGLRVKVDDREIRPGQKYYQWELKGIPLRLEVGPRDVESNQFFAARRTGGKEAIVADELVQRVRSMLEEVASVLRTRASDHVQSVVHPLPAFDAEAWTMETDVEEGRIYHLPFAGTDQQAESIERMTGLTFLGTAMEGYPTEEACPITGKLTTSKVLLGRTY